MAAALWATGDRQARRAAWRGLGSMAAASTAANGPARSTSGRQTGQPTWLSTDGEVAIAESGFVHGKHPHALVVYRKADG